MIPIGTKVKIKSRAELDKYVARELRGIFLPSNMLKYVDQIVDITRHIQGSYTDLYKLYGNNYSWRPEWFDVYPLKTKLGNIITEGTL